MKCPLLSCDQMAGRTSNPITSVECPMAGQIIPIGSAHYVQLATVRFTMGQMVRSSMTSYEGASLNGKSEFL